MKKRSFALKGHRTSIALEPEFWETLDAVARRDGRSLAALVSEIDAARSRAEPAPGLASALRVFALKTASGR